MKRVVLVTGHYYFSKRKAGFHWLAEAFCRAGWDVVFFTVSLSWLSWLRRDYRMAFPVRAEAGRAVRAGERLTSFVWWTPWHPANLRAGLLNRLSSPVFRRYGELSLGRAEELVAGADLFVFESTPGLLLFDVLRPRCPAARFVYRVSDDLRLLRSHPVVIETEARIAGRFDLVSTPSEYLWRRFAHLPRAALHLHGLDPAAFDRDVPGPYAGPWRAHAVFVGSAHLDRDFLARAAGCAPDCGFHVIGAVGAVRGGRNVFVYGELPFDETVAYIRHADVGLHTLAYRAGAESFTDSLKVIQYTYCRLPVVAPEFLRSSRTNFFYYRPGDSRSIAAALEDARRFDRRAFSPPPAWTWDDLARALAGEGAAGAGPPAR